MRSQQIQQKGAKVWQKQDVGASPAIPGIDVLDLQVIGAEATPREFIIGGAGIPVSVLSELRWIGCTEAWE
jgi:hypothetical protein